MTEEFTTGGCSPSDCASCSGCSNPEGNCQDIEDRRTITLTLDDDTEVECAILTIFPVDAKEYIALLPLDVKYISIPLPAQNPETRFFPISKAMKSTTKLPLHLTLFCRMQRILWKKLRNNVFRLFLSEYQKTVISPITCAYDSFFFSQISAYDLISQIIQQ